MSTYFIAASVALFFLRAGLMLGTDRARTGSPALDLLVAALWLAFGGWGIAVLIGLPR